MRCFTACFGTNSNHKKIIIKPCGTCSSSNKIDSISPQALQDLLEIDENGEASVAAINPQKEEARHKIVNPINLFEESKDEEEEEEELNKSSKKNLLKTCENGEDFVSINATKEESKKKEEDELNRISGRKKVTFDPNVSIYDDGLLANQVSANCSEINPSNLQKQNGEEEEEEEEEGNELSNSSVSSYISYPPNHRYHCCRNSDDGLEDIDLEDDANNNNENDDDVEYSPEESSSNESLFSLSIDSTRRGNNPMPEMSDKEEVNSPLKQQSIKVSVLNPFRCPSQLKDTSSTTPSSLLKKMGKFGQGDAEIVLQDPLRVQGLLKQQEKENVDVNLLDFGITYDDQRVQGETFLKSQENEIAVDASLSSWLVESSQDDTPNSKNSAGSVGNSPLEKSVRLIDRQILGALKVEELKDEKHLVIGTVGSYLRHTGLATGISSC